MGKPTIPRNRVPNKHVDARLRSNDSTRRAHEDHLDTKYIALMRTYLQTLPTSRRSRLCFRIHNLIKDLGLRVPQDQSCSLANL